MLESFGLTRLEAQVYLALLMRSEAEAKEIVQILNIHFPQFYSITSNLKRKRFIETRGGGQSDIVPLILKKQCNEK